MDVERLLRDLGGAARPGDLGRSGTVRRAVERLVAEGRIERHHGDCLALPGADPDILRARQLRALLTCVSAARAHGFSLLDEPITSHLAIPHRRGPIAGVPLLGARALIHREVPALLTAAPHPGVESGRGPLVVAPAEALARMLRCQHALSAIVAIDSALNSRACTVGDIAGVLIGPGSPAARAVLAECDGRSLSPPETVARVALRRAGYGVEPNAFIGGVGHVDLLVEDGWSSSATATPTTRAPGPSHRIGAATAPSRSTVIRPSASPLTRCSATLRRSCDASPEYFVAHDRCDAGRWPLARGDGMNRWAIGDITARRRPRDRGVPAPPARVPGYWRYRACTTLSTIEAWP